MDSFIGTIIYFAGSFAPRGWALCQGQLLSIAQYNAVFAILGTTYGGDGVTTFGLPDLRGRVPVGPGQGPGLSNIARGQLSGTESVTLLTSQLPSHVHTASPTTAVDVKATLQTPEAGAFLGRAVDGSGNGGQPRVYVPAAGGASATKIPLSNTAGTTGATGGNLPHSIRDPYLGIYPIICLEGIFPSRN